MIESGENKCSLMNRNIIGILCVIAIYMLMIAAIARYSISEAVLSEVKKNREVIYDRCGGADE